MHTASMHLMKLGRRISPVGLREHEHTTTDPPWPQLAPHSSSLLVPYTTRSRTGTHDVRCNRSFQFQVPCLYKVGTYIRVPRILFRSVTSGGRLPAASSNSSRKPGRPTLAPTAARSPTPAHGRQGNAPKAGRRPKGVGSEGVAETSAAPHAGLQEEAARQSGLRPRDDKRQALDARRRRRGWHHFRDGGRRVGRLRGICRFTLFVRNWDRAGHHRGIPSRFAVCRAHHEGGGAAHRRG